MNSYRILLCTLLLCLSGVVSASSTYNVMVDTSSITGTAGSMDFNFNPGPLATQAASLQILNFSSDGALAGGSIPSGNVSGTLPSTLIFDNGTGLNDYFDGFTYGSKLSFLVSLFGPALDSPDGTSTSGSTFAFSMFSDTAATIPALTSDTTNGFAFTVDVNLDGTTTVTNSSAQTTVSAVPLPAAIWLFGSALTGLIGFVRRKPRQ